MLSPTDVIIGLTAIGVILGVGFVVFMLQKNPDSGWDDDDSDGWGV